jgi:hypothetical protein
MFISEFVVVINSHLNNETLFVPLTMFLVEKPSVLVKLAADFKTDNVTQSI